MLNLRKAIPADLPLILEFLRSWAEESLPEHGLGWEDEQAKWSLCQFIANNERILIVAEEEGKLLGTIAGSIGTSLFDVNDVRLSCPGWYVEKGSRGGGVARKLLHVLELWGESKGATSVVMASFQDHDRTKKLYERLGFERLETLFIRRI